MASLRAPRAFSLLLATLGVASADVSDGMCSLQVTKVFKHNELAEDKCAAAGEDPYASADGTCCGGLSKCLGTWDNDGRHFYKCYADCHNPEAPPTPMPPTPAPSPMGDGSCLCVFDIDRTLTGKQSDTNQCKHDEVVNNCRDTAYGGGEFTLSEVGQSLHGTFCAKHQCFVGIVTAGDASGPNSCERRVLAEHLANGGGKLVSQEWTGPSKYGDARRSCRGVDVTSPLVVGCEDGTKQFAVEGMVKWLEQTSHVHIPLRNVWMFDDRSQNVEPFSGTGMNAIQISCESRDYNRGIGVCGATSAEIVPDMGVHTCT